MYMLWFLGSPCLATSCLPTFDLCLLSWSLAHLACLGSCLSEPFSPMTALYKP